ncbi:ester cyclase [Vibrio campbellii]|uniref:ester cyclase n=1 Tax=Vibrio campbellii TaxID=680 RepID=UPI003D120688
MLIEQKVKLSKSSAMKSVLVGVKEGGAVANIKFNIDQLLVIGDRVVTYLNFSGVFSGSFYGHEGDGRTVNYILIDIYRFKDGLIIESWHIEDNFNLYKQLGIISF